MLSPFIVNDKNLFLERFPPAQVTRSLQAWDATDEYLLNQCTPLLEQSEAPLRIAIFNDSFGAIACSLTEHEIFVISDSFVSHQGVKHNLMQNHLDEQNVQLLSSVDPLPEAVDIVLYKIPKSKSLLAKQLSEIGQTYDEGIQFIAGAKAKEIHSSTLKVFEKYLGTTKTSLAVKKSRLVFCDNDLANTPPYSGTKSWSLENTTFEISNLANVFAREQLDIGARLFLDHLPNVAQKQVIDLGCGNGVLGLSLLANNSDCQLMFRDESYMAVASAKQNIENNLPELINNAQFSCGDCLTDIDSNSVDTVVCNPPFHQQQAVTDHIAWQMFKDSFRVLKRGGELRIVGNRQLGYHIKLKRLFGNSTTIASNKKFVILSAVKK